MNGKLKGVMGAPITPFTEENKVDFDSFSKQINFLIENGIKMISHPMHIGESINLNEKEQKDLVNCLVEAAGNRVPVFVHVSKAGTDLARELALYSQNSGASGVNPWESLIKSLSRFLKLSGRYSADIRKGIETNMNPFCYEVSTSWAVYLVCDIRARPALIAGVPELKWKKNSLGEVLVSFLYLPTIFTTF